MSSDHDSDMFNMKETEEVTDTCWFNMSVFGKKGSVL